MQSRYDVVYIGNYTKDEIITPSETRHVDGGAVNYAAYAAGRLRSKVAVVMRLAREDQYVVDRLRAANIDCYPVYSPSSTLMVLEYPTTDPDLRHLWVKGVAGAITAADVEGLDTRYAVIGSSLRGEVGFDVIQALKAKNVQVGADMQGFVRVLNGRELEYKAWPEMNETLAAVDIVKSDMVEAEFLTGETDIYRAAEHYAALGPKEIVLTHRDGVLIWVEGRAYEYPFCAMTLVGRSGRGDTCVGTYVAMRVNKEPQAAGLWAAAVTSMKMEKLGPFDRTVPEVEQFIKAHYNGHERQ